MTRYLTWTTLAKACLLLSYLDSVQYVNSETPPSAIPLKDVGGTDDTKLPLTTIPSHSSSMNTQLVDSHIVSTGVVLHPTPTHLSDSTVLMVSETNTREVTPQLTSHDTSKLSPLDIHVSTYSASVLSISEKTSSFLIDSSLSTSIFPTTLSSIVEDFPSTQSTATFSTLLTTKIPSSTIDIITNSSSPLLTSPSNNSLNNSTNTSPVTPVNTISSSSSATEPGTTTVLGHQNVTLNITTPIGSTTTTPGEQDRLHKDPEEDQLKTPAIIGIGFGAAAFVLILIGVGLLVMKKKVYRRNKHDPTNFWDDNVTLSYINSHADFPKDFDAEMMSLDDDSFLNSLDSVTFANIWATDTAKHTNF